MKSVNMQIELLSLKDDANEGPEDLAGGEHRRVPEEGTEKERKQANRN